MSWVKLDTAFQGHPKVIAAGRDARDVYLAGLSWAGAYLTDGFVPAWCLTRLAADAAGGDGARIDPGAAAQRLLAVGLWEKAPGGFQIHDYLRHQTPRATMRATARKRAQAGAVGGARPGKQNASKTQANGEANAEQTVEQNASNAEANPQTNAEANAEQKASRLRSKEEEVRDPPPDPPTDVGGLSASETVVYDDDGNATRRPRERARLDDRLAYADWLRDLDARRRELEARDDALADEKAARASSP